MKGLLPFTLPLLVMLSSFQGYHCIVGGKVATAETFRYAVAFIEDSEELVICGGSILNEDYILTSGSCADNIEEEFETKYIHYGSIDRNKGSKLGIKNITRHPDYDADTLENNIALITPNETIKMSDEVQPIKLPTSDHPNGGGIRVNLSGWGPTLVSNCITLHDVSRRFP